MYGSLRFEIWILRLLFCQTQIYYPCFYKISPRLFIDILVNIDFEVLHIIIMRWEGKVNLGLEYYMFIEICTYFLELSINNSATRELIRQGKISTRFQPENSIANWIFYVIRFLDFVVSHLNNWFNFRKTLFIENCDFQQNNNNFITHHYSSSSFIINRLNKIPTN